MNSGPVDNALGASGVAGTHAVLSGFYGPGPEEAESRSRRGRPNDSSARGSPGIPGLLRRGLAGRHFADRNVGRVLAADNYVGVSTTCRAGCDRFRSLETFCTELVRGRFLTPFEAL